jgi:heme exporter protein A
MLSCENLTCMRGDAVLFRDLGFCLPLGSLLLLKGPNGVGKTSLLRVLCGLLTPRYGHIAWDGNSITHNDDFKRDLMVVGHKSAVKLESTVEENIRFWARLFGTETLIPAALKYYDLTPFKDSPAAELSAGWQRRVALARLVVAPCRLWLLDEPTNFLDDNGVLLTASLIESRVTQGGIVVVASHIMNSSIAAHTLWLQDFTSPVRGEVAEQREAGGGKVREGKYTPSRPSATLPPNGGGVHV